MYEFQQIIVKAQWQAGIHKIDKDFGIAEVRQPNFIKVIILHKLIENISTKHNSLRDFNGHPRELIEKPIAFYNGIEKRKTPRLPTNRTFTNTGETDVFIESIGVELCNDTSSFV